MAIRETFIFRSAYKYIGTGSVNLVLRKLAHSQTMTSAYQRNKDEKAMFGGVLETKREKLRNRRLKGINSLQSAPDSEAYWLCNAKKHAAIINKLRNNTEEYNMRPINSSFENLGAIDLSKGRPLAARGKGVTSPLSVPLLSSDPPRPLLQCFSPEQSAYPSVTRVLSGTMSESSKAALERWKQKMIAQLGEEGFLAFNKEQLSFGARLHAHIQRFLSSGHEGQLEPDMEATWSSLASVLSKVSNVNMLEANIYHPKLEYKGIVDCVASYEGIPCIIEWKVSQNQKPKLSSTYDAPLQLTAYLGAVSYQTSQRISNGVVVVAYKNGAPAHAFPMSENECRKNWALWLIRLQTYRESNQ